MKIPTLLVGLALVARLVAASAEQSPPVTNYVIGPTDVLKVTIYGVPDLDSKSYTVDADGMFTFPMVGRLQAAGLTVAELEAALRNKLAPEYLRNPQISVSIDDYRSKQIIVSGEVARPGPQPFTDGLTLLGVLTRAGGVMSSAAGEVLIAHGPALKTNPGTSGSGDDPDVRFDGVRVDLTKLQAGALELDIAIRNGDKILVPRAEVAFVFGEVKNPGGYPAQTNMTVRRIVSLAGGLTPHASSDRISIDRDGKTLPKVTLAELVKPGDIITVPRRSFWR